jgi:hypothetical protein
VIKSRTFDAAGRRLRYPWINRVEFLKMMLLMRWRLSICFKPIGNEQPIFQNNQHTHQNPDPATPPGPLFDTPCQLIRRFNQHLTAAFRTRLESEEHDVTAVEFTPKCRQVWIT